MADDDYGPAQPIADVVKGAYKKANDFMNMLPSPPKAIDPTQPKNVDTSWHDSMVKAAQDKKAADDAAAAKQSQKIPTQTKAQKRPPVALKMQIKPSVKPGPQKAVGGK
jgi:hypothetical protein